MRSAEPAFLAESAWDGRHVHFMGAGGIGVSALVEAAAARGARVSGCDLTAGGQLPRLRARGFEVAAGHSPAHLEQECDLLVHTAAVAEGHPEVKRARELGVPVLSRMRFLAALARGRRAYCITGAHGKTSVTWFLAHLLIAAERDPTVVVGGEVPALGGNFRAGQGQGFVVETDESDNRLHEFEPFAAVVTNVDAEHLGAYGGDLHALECAYSSFWLRALERGGTAFGCGDDPRLRPLAEETARRAGRPVTLYGLGKENTVRAERVRREGAGSVFTVSGPFGELDEVRIPLPGKHNVVNALAALTVARLLGVEEDVLREAAAKLETVGRRLELKGEAAGVLVVDDYAHHPREVTAALEGARLLAAERRKGKTAGGGRLGVVFQPHRYSRLAALRDDFARALAVAEAVFLLPVYAASEKPLPGVDHEALAAQIEKVRAANNTGKEKPAGKTPVKTAADLDEAAAQAAAWAKPGDLVVTQGAGTVTMVAPKLLRLLSEAETNGR